MLLVVIADFHICTQAKASLVCGEQPVQYFQQSGFAGSVVTDNRHMLSLSDLQIDMLEQQGIAEGFPQIFQNQHVVSAFFPGDKPDMHVCAHFRRLLQDFRLFQQFFTALCPSDEFFPVKGPQLLNNRFLMPDFPLLV